jgi:DNA-binding NarL/FixJ family response regulator
MSGKAAALLDATLRTARELGMRTRTVATHVRNILTKTGTANRTEAAAYAMRHGLGAE